MFETIIAQESSEHNGALPSQALPWPCQTSLTLHSSSLLNSESGLRSVCSHSKPSQAWDKDVQEQNPYPSVYLLHKERGKGLPVSLRGSSGSWGPLYTFHLPLWFHEPLLWPCVFHCKHIATCMLNKQINKWKPLCQYQTLPSFFPWGKRRKQTICDRC